jgi:hypothetical protein
MRRPANEAEQNFASRKGTKLETADTAKSDLTNAEPVSLFYPLATSILLLELTLKSVRLNSVRDFDPQ